MIGGGLCIYTFVRREDHAKKAIQRTGKLRVWNFGPSVRTFDNAANQGLTDSNLCSLLSGSLIPFLCKINVSAAAKWSQSFHDLRVIVFQLGWETPGVEPDSERGLREASMLGHRKPYQTKTNLRLPSAAYAKQSKTIDIFTKYAYLGLPVDAVAMKRGYVLNCDIVNPISKLPPVIYTFYEDAHMTTPTFVSQCTHI
jgi:hypothetical protein